MFVDFVMLSLSSDKLKVSLPAVDFKPTTNCAC